jgi:hypothetical protein
METNNDLILTQFLENCKKESEFIDIYTFKNSIIVHFDKNIYSNIFEHLKKLSNKIMLYNTENFYTGQQEICLFIYKDLNYNYEID